MAKVRPVIEHIVPGRGQDDAPMVALKPPIEPHERGMLDVGDGHVVATSIVCLPTSLPSGANA